MLLSPFVQGMKDGGFDVEVLYASSLNVKPCSCSDRYCWYTKPGTCCITDDIDFAISDFGTVSKYMF